MFLIDSIFFCFRESGGNFLNADKCGPGSLLWFQMEKLDSRKADLVATSDWFSTEPRLPWGNDLLPAPSESSLVITPPSRLCLLANTVELSFSALWFQAPRSSFWLVHSDSKECSGLGADEEFPRLSPLQCHSPSVTSPGILSLHFLQFSCFHTQFHSSSHWNQISNLSFIKCNQWVKLLSMLDSFAHNK